MMHELLNAYDDLLIGKREVLGNYYFPNNTKGGKNETKVLILIRYALECLLDWDIKKALNKFDMYILQLMKLDKYLCYIDFPVSVLPTDTRYILSLLYPNAVHYPEKKQIENTLKTVLSDNLQFPRNFFSGEKGKYRFQKCLQYLITQYKSFSSLEDIYLFFSSQDGMEFLELFRLRSPAIQYNIDLLDIIFDITKKENNSILYYYFYKFLNKTET